ncbi:PrpF domain-containing protein [Amycolatopsis anabasis]|uniref:PrpF domain-containing protein n=1 Tax=Amycolatopsis anabasis TaxID=1840409 RepID=UPI00131D07E2|nr:PrpF domain-containing protein [Amycolatopsis anabasis]
MLAHIAHAHGSPSSTLVLTADSLPAGEAELSAALGDATGWLARQGLDHITKIALVTPSAHPLFDIDYRFVQVLPGERTRFDFRGSCGHSVLSSVVVASRLGWVGKLAPEHRVRVRVRNNDDHVVCEVDESVRNRTTFTAHFLNHPAVRLESLLPLGTTTTDLPYDDGGIRISGVSVGNPYVFLAAEDLGVHTEDELFADNEKLFDTMSRIRRSAATSYGWPVDGAFPKVAAVLPAGDQAVAVRAISVPSWHPTLALTGAVCLGAASKIRGTIPFKLAGAAARPGNPLEIRTKGGVTVAAASVSGNEPDSELSWVSVPEKAVTFTGAITIDSLQPHVRKEDTCLLST